MAPELGKVRRADVPIVGDARETIVALIEAVRGEQEAGRIPDLTAWWAQHGVMPGSMSMEARSLEDVFLDISGRDVR